MLRNYDAASTRVQDSYRKMRSNQDISFVARISKLYAQPSGTILNVWDCIDSLREFIDLSDPDMDLPNSVHLYQTAEAIRKAGLPDWMQLTGLIHDMGKCIYLRGCDDHGTSMKEQWAIVGDTFIVGDPLPSTLVYSQFNHLNKDHKESIYSKGCGLDKCTVSYGHDEYLYQVLQRSGHNLPVEALYMIRYHSLYAWHRDGCYLDLENSMDRKMKQWVKKFNEFDLYTKENRDYTTDEIHKLRQYYDNLITKYLPYPMIL